MSMKSEAIKAAIHIAVLRSIREMGIEKFKKTSFFGSTHRKSNENYERNEKAA